MIELFLLWRSTHPKTCFAVNSPNAPDIGSRLHLLSNFGIVADQANKLDVGRTISIT